MPARSSRCATKRPRRASESPGKPANCVENVPEPHDAPTCIENDAGPSGNQPGASLLAPTGTPLPPTGGTVATAALPSPDHFLATTYRDGEFARAAATRGEIFRLDHEEDVDVHISEITGRIVIRPQTGPPLKLKGTIPGVGPDVGRVLLEELMWQPGEFLTVDYLLKNKALGSFVTPDARAVCVTRLLTAFGEDREHPWFFELAYHPWRIRWNPDRSWRIIERLA